MKHLRLTTGSLSAAAAALYLMLSCSACTPRVITPLYQDAEFAATHITEPVYLMPVVDLRLDKTKNLHLDDNARKWLSPGFEKKGYGRPRLVADRKMVEFLMEDDFTQPDSGLLATLGPSDARWLFCPVLHDFKSKITFGSTANVEISGYIVDKKRGKIVWRHKGIGQAGQGGLIGMAMKGMVEEEALDSALLTLLSAVPSKGDTGKRSGKK